MNGEYESSMRCVVLLPTAEGGMPLGQALAHDGAFDAAPGGTWHSSARSHAGSNGEGGLES